MLYWPPSFLSFPLLLVVPFPSPSFFPPSSSMRRVLSCLFTKCISFVVGDSQPLDKSPCSWAAILTHFCMSRLCNWSARLEREEEMRVFDVEVMAGPCSRWCPFPNMIFLLTPREFHIMRPNLTPFPVLPGPPTYCNLSPKKLKIVKSHHFAHRLPEVYYQRLVF